MERGRTEGIVTGNNRHQFSTLCARGRTCLVRDVDRRAGRRTVSSAGHGVDGDDVIATGLQIIDCCSRLRSRNGELFRVTVAPWTDSGVKAKCSEQMQMHIGYTLTCHLSVGDPVVAHSDRWSIPADGDAGRGGFQHFQICGSVRDCGGGDHISVAR